MMENRPTGDAEAVGAINKELRAQCPGLAGEAGLTRVAVVGRGKCRNRQARTLDGLDWRRSGRWKWNAQTIEGSSAGKLDLEQVLRRGGDGTGALVGINRR